MTNTTASTTIIIPGRETQVINGLTLGKAEIIASFAGDIDLSGFVATETRDGSNVTVAFANRTGTKGNDIYVTGDLNLQVEGDVVINSTRIEIPGREAQVIPGLRMSQSDVRASFAGEIDLAAMNCSESTDGDTHVISFANRTGTKGTTNVLSAIFAAVEEAQATQAREAAEAELEEEYDEFEEDETLVNTRVSIPGREDLVIRGMVLDAQMVKDSFSGDIDLSGYNVEEIENGNTLDVVFTARTGTKGEA